ncbi:hypothetical protein E2C01_022635 [Portunus trituberculatus]|uniref:Uncharacterized protein n=1 Tax=Portunus trituberculatus TaxID=210409 RepID=A0A5B7E7U4_PORTR|nr:hypothetical protein [Portunus trituberculatus]
MWVAGPCVPVRGRRLTRDRISVATDLTPPTHRTHFSACRKTIGLVFFSMTKKKVQTNMKAHYNEPGRYGHQDDEMSAREEREER